MSLRDRQPSAGGGSIDGMRQGDLLDLFRRTAGETRGQAAGEGARARAEQAERLSREVLEACRERLRHEWHQANFTYLGNQLRPPSIEIEPSKTRWGSWCRATRTLAVSRRLVTQYRWESVVEVLRHEMAHQVVDELMGVQGVTPHGQLFRQACELLACDPRASGPGGVALDAPPGEAGGEARDDARLRKIRRLLALADSSNVHEAEAALAKANELLLKYNLDLLEVGAERDYVVRTVGQPMPRRPRHIKVLAGILSEFFFVETIWVETYDVQSMRGGKVLEICGTAANVDLAEYTHAELQRAAAELWERHRAETGCSGRLRRQYLDGVLMGFSDRLDRERKTLATRRDLVWVGDPGLDAFYRRRHPRIARESVAVGGTRAFEAGKEAGAQLRLRRAIRAHRGDRGHALEHRQ